MRDCALSIPLVPHLFVIMHACLSPYPQLGKAMGAEWRGLSEAQKAKFKA